MGQSSLSLGQVTLSGQHIETPLPFLFLLLPSSV